MKKCYAVVGETGEYSDRQIWISKIFADKGLADKVAKEYKDEAQFLFRKYEEYYRIPDRVHSDPKFSCDYTGTGYSVQEIDFEDKSFFEKLGER